MKYSIGIVTYVKRYEKYFIPLIKQIKYFRPDIEVIVQVNGEHKQDFNPQYRSEILRFCSNYDNIFPSVHPNFRSLSKLWNSCLINSSNNIMLLLNDDITISSHLFFDNLEKIILSDDIDCFKINSSWSHVVLNRKQVNEIGWFDERFLGVGEEDSDFEWRWQNSTKKPFMKLNVPYIINHVEHQECLTNIKIVNNKYSAFNHNFAFTEKYTIDNDKGKNYGMAQRNLVCISETPTLYPVEKFYWDNKDRL